MLDQKGDEGNVLVDASHHQGSVQVVILLFDVDPLLYQELCYLVVTQNHTPVQRCISIVVFVVNGREVL